MRHRILIAIGVVFLLLGLAEAQQTPTLTETEALLVQLVQTRDALAACQQQATAAKILDAAGMVQRRLEAAHPGFTIDWKTGALVAK